MELSGIRESLCRSQFAHALSKKGNSKARGEHWVQMGRVTWHWVTHGPSATDSAAFKRVIKSLKSKERQDVNYVNFCHLGGSERHHCREITSNILSKPKGQNMHCKVLLQHMKCNPVTNSDEILCSVFWASALHHGGGSTEEFWVRTGESSHNLSKEVIRARKVKFFLDQSIWNCC